MTTTVGRAADVLQLKFLRTIRIAYVAFDPVQLERLRGRRPRGQLRRGRAGLHVTPSAVSQRIKALEQAVGQVLVRRTARACPPTPGALCAWPARSRCWNGGPAGPHRAARAPAGHARLPVVVNADSLATWFLPALAALPADVLLDLHRDDQDHTADLLRDGTVMAAVTADRARCRAAGCNGWARCATAPSRRPPRGTWFAGGRARGVRGRADAAFNRKDPLQHRFVARSGRRRTRRPLRAVGVGVRRGVRLGLGWGLVPEARGRPDRRRRARRARAGRHLDVPLYWQHWALRTPTLDDLTERVVTGGVGGSAAGATPRAPPSAG